MTDLEITKACAEAMGFSVIDSHGVYGLLCGRELDSGYGEGLFDPLHDDAQAMALVKKFGLNISWGPERFNEWCVWVIVVGQINAVSSQGPNLNRAICECVAKLQKAKP